MSFIACLKPAAAAAGFLHMPDKLSHRKEVLSVIM